MITTVQATIYQPGLWLKWRASWPLPWQIQTLSAQTSYHGTTCNTPRHRVPSGGNPTFYCTYGKSDTVDATLDPAPELAQRIDRLSMARTLGSTTKSGLGCCWFGTGALHALWEYEVDSGAVDAGCWVVDHGRIVAKMLAVTRLAVRLAIVFCQRRTEEY